MSNRKSAGSRALVPTIAPDGVTAVPHRSRTGNRQMARELHALLERARQRVPYVVVARAMGGSNAPFFATERPDRVAGMVRLDAVGDDQPSRYWALFAESAKAQLRDMYDKVPGGLDFDTLVAGFA